MRLGRWLATCVAACALAQGAAAYQVEVGVVYDSDTNNSDDVKDGIGISGRYFFSPVRSNGPHDEAAFLDRVMTADLEFQSLTGEEWGIEGGGSMFEIGFHYADPDIPVAADIRYTSESLEADSLAASRDTGTLLLRAGYLVMPTLYVGLAYAQDDITERDIPLLGDDDYTIDYTDLEVKYVTEVSNGSFLNLEGAYGTVTSNGMDINRGQLAVDYYFTPLIGIGVSYMGMSGDNDATMLGFSVMYDVTSQFGVRVSQENYSDTGYEETITNVKIVGRF